MILLRRIAVLLFAALVFLAGPVSRSQAAEISLSGGGLKLTLDKGTGEITRVAETSTDRLLSVGRGGLKITSYAETTSLLPAPIQTAKQGKAGADFKWNFPNQQLEVSQHIEAFSDRISWKVSLVNSGTNLQKLEVSLVLPIASAGNDNYWDGFQLFSPATPGLKREKIENTFPLACRYDNNSGVALGIEPHQYLSYLANGTGDKSFYYATRTVVDPGKTETIEFVLFGFQPSYGFLDAIQSYYAIYPEVFDPSPGTDPRLLGGGGYIQSSPETRRLMLEHCRRSNLVWEWCYGPYQKNGDWFPDEKDWSPEKPFGREAHTQKHGFYTHLEYVSMLEERFSAGNRAAAMMYYIIPRLADVDLVDREHPDAIFIDENQKRSGISLGEVKSDSRDYAVYPYGNSLFARETEDIRKIVSQYQVRGFAFDMVDGATRFYGPGALVSPGKAYDDKGEIYSILPVAFAKLMDFIHTLYRDNYRMGVVANLASHDASYLSAFHSDAVMWETIPYQNPENLMAHRYLSGRKLLTWWGGRLIPLRWSAVDVSKLKPEEAAEVYQGLTDYIILCSLKTGGMPMNWLTMSAPRIMAAAPLINRLARAGWNPVPAVKTDNPKVWVARFGKKGERAFLTISNPTFETIKTRVVIDNRYFGDYAPLFFNTPDIKKTPLFLVGKDQTEFEIELAPKEFLFLKETGRTRLESSENARVKIEQKSEANQKEKITITLESSTPIKPEAMIFLSEKAAGISLAKDNTAPTPVAIPGWIKFSAPARTHTLEVVYEPHIMIASPKNEILGFLTMDQLEKETGKYLLVVGDKAGPEELLAAERVDAYFPYYLARKAMGYPTEIWNFSKFDSAFKIPIVKASEAAKRTETHWIVVGGPSNNEAAQALEGKLIFGHGKNQGFVQVLKTDSNQKSVPAKKVLYLGGTDPAETTQAVLKYLDLLSEVTPYFR